MTPTCNICGSTAFADMRNRRNVRCAACNSLERTRLMWLHIARMEIGEGTRILHLAPEPGVYRALRAMTAPGNYVCADFEPKNFAFAPDIRFIDLCALDDWPTGGYDLILHSHVLEHTPCNIAYTFFHLHRMLAPEGLHLACVPFLPGRYDESFAEMPDEERVRRFGQNDHVRRYGAEDVERHLGKVVNVPESWSALDTFTEDELRGANIPESCWHGFQPNTILSLRRGDMKFIAGA